MNPEHTLAPRQDEPTEETTEATAPELLIPKRQLVIQPLSNDVVPDKTEKQEREEQLAKEATPDHVEPTSYTEAVEMREAARAQAQNQPKEVNKKFVPDPKLLPPVVESNTGGIIAIFALMLLLGAGAFAWYYFKVK